MKKLLIVAALIVAARSAGTFAQPSGGTGCPGCSCVRVQEGQPGVLTCADGDGKLYRCYGEPAVFCVAFQLCPDNDC